MRKPTDRFSDDEDTPTQFVTYEWGEEVQPSTAVVEAVAATTGQEPTDLPPLYDCVDGEALDTLLQSGSASRSGPIDVRFRYEGVMVTARSDGHIAIDHDPGME
jgi:hypothetical protein